MTDIAKYMGGGGGSKLGDLKRVHSGIPGDELVQDGETWIKTGVLNPYDASFDDLIAARPDTAVMAATTAKIISNPGLRKIVKIGSKYCAFFNAYNYNAIYTADSLSGPWTAVAGFSTLTGGWAYDITVFNGYGVVSCSNKMLYSADGLTWTAVACADLTSPYGVVASGSLAVALDDTNSGGGLYTSTDGVAWTRRDGIGAPSTQRIFRAAWCPAGNVFFYIDELGRALSTTDGYTLTDNGIVISALPALSTPSYGNSRLNAASPTANIVSAGTGYLRTTDGINFAEITDVPLGNVIYLDGCFYGVYDGYLYKSTDDGLTFTLQGHLINFAESTAIPDTLLEIDAQKIMLATNNANGYVALLDTFAKNYVGTTAITETGMNLYMRSK